MWRIQITSEPHDSKYLKRLEKQEGKEDTTTEQIPETSGGKKESGKVEIVPGKDSEKLKATKEAGREESEGVNAMKEVLREARESREEAIRQEHRNVQEHHKFANNPYAYPAPRKPAPGKPREKVTKTTVTYENPEPDRYAVDDYNYVM